METNSLLCLPIELIYNILIKTDNIVAIIRFCSSCKHFNKININRFIGLVNTNYASTKFHILNLIKKKYTNIGYFYKSDNYNKKIDFFRTDNTFFFKVEYTGLLHYPITLSFHFEKINYTLSLSITLKYNLRKVCFDFLTDLNYDNEISSFKQFKLVKDSRILYVTGSTTQYRGYLESDWTVKFKDGYIVDAKILPFVSFLNKLNESTIIDYYNLFKTPNSLFIKFINQAHKENIFGITSENFDYLSFISRFL